LPPAFEGRTEGSARAYGPSFGLRSGHVAQTGNVRLLGASMRSTIRRFIPGWLNRGGFVGL
jgi:hypothetical protein